MSQEMEDKNRMSVLFTKYVAGEASEKEIQDLLDLIKTRDADSELNTDMQMLWDNIQAAPEEAQVDWDQKYAAIISAEAPERIVSPGNKRIWFGIAASLFVGLIALFIWFQRSRQNQYPTSDLLKQTAAAGTTVQVQLSDGSKVTLNSGSKLCYPKSFKQDKREVYLEGEAYFDVAHDTRKPFIVQSGKLKTTVLGTSFNVMAYPGMSTAAVTVLTGKVAVKHQDNKQTVMLTPDVRAVSDNTDRDFVIDTVKNAKEVIAWQAGELIFNDVTLEEIALRIGYRFNLKVEIKSKTTGQRRITAIFNKQSFLHIMDAITQLTDSKYRQTDDHYIIY